VTFFAYLLKLPGIDNDRFDLHWRLAEYHLAKGNHPAARETLDRALAIRPQDPTCWFLLAVVGDATGDELLAEQSARRSLKLKVTPEACRLLARIYLGAGNFLAAGPVLKQALDLQPNNIDSHFLLAVMLAQQGLVREAVDELDQILAVRPGHTDAQALRAELLQGPNHIGPTFRR
jgi:Tfp pilus assembly protein PilF